MVIVRKLVSEKKKKKPEKQDIEIIQTHMMKKIFTT